MPSSSPNSFDLGRAEKSCSNPLRHSYSYQLSIHKQKKILYEVDWLVSGKPKVSKSSSIMGKLSGTILSGQDPASAQKSWNKHCGGL
jgi:hypothetical protein